MEAAVVSEPCFPRLVSDIKHVSNSIISQWGAGGIGLNESTSTTLNPPCLVSLYESFEQLPQTKELDNRKFTWAKPLWTIKDAQYMKAAMIIWKVRAKE